MNTETRIRYDTLDLKYNPDTDGPQWEVWCGGETETVGNSPLEALKGYGDMTDMIAKYTKDGVPRHEVEPDDYDREEIVAGTGIRVEDIPPKAVGQHVWNAFRNTTDSQRRGDSIWIPDVCERTGIDRDAAFMIVRLLAARGLVDWGTSIRGPFLTDDGRARRRADASLSDLDLLGETERDPSTDSRAAGSGEDTMWDVDPDE